MESINGVANVLKKGPARRPPRRILQDIPVPKEVHETMLRQEEAESTEGIPGSSTANISQEKETIEPG